MRILDRNPYKVPLTTEVVEKLKLRFDSAGISRNELIESMGPERPTELNSTMLTYWLNGRVKTAKSKHLAMIWGALDKYERVRDNQFIPDSVSGNTKTINSDDNVPKLD